MSRTGSSLSAEDKTDEHGHTVRQSLVSFPRLGTKPREGPQADTRSMTVTDIHGHFADYLL